MSVGRLAPKHSLDLEVVRPMSKNVDKALIKDDIILIDRLQGRSIEEYTNDRFRPVIDAYNKKQKRKDRRINCDYVEWHKNNGTLSQGAGQLAYEAVLQYGTHEDLGGEYYSPDTSPERKEEIKQEYLSVYKEWVGILQEKYPHMELLYAAIHMSEPAGTIHLHTCFQPVGDCTRGLSQQVSIGRALTQDGIERISSREEAKQAGGYQLARFYKEFHHKYQNPTLQRLGYEIKEEKHGIKHMEKDGYAVVMEQAEKKAQEIVKAAETRKERVNVETEKIKVQTLELVKQKHDEVKHLEQKKQVAKKELDEIETKAMFAAMDIKTKQKEASTKALATLEQANEEAEHIIANASSKALEAVEAAKKAKLDAEQAERKKAAAIAAEAAIRTEAKQAAEIEVRELKAQLKEKDSVINKLNAKIGELSEKLTKLRQYLQEKNILQNFLSWVKGKGEFNDGNQSYTTDDYERK